MKKNLGDKPTAPIVPNSRSYEFGPFCLDAARRLLFRDGGVVSIPPKAIETLLVLVERQGQLIETDELIDLVWPNLNIVNNNLTFNICKLRRALGETPKENRYIATVSGRGYRFVAEVKQTDAGCVSKLLPPIGRIEPLIAAYNFTHAGQIHSSSRTSFQIATGQMSPNPIYVPASERLVIEFRGEKPQCSILISFHCEEQQREQRTVKEMPPLRVSGDVREVVDDDVNDSL